MIRVYDGNRDSRAFPKDLRGEDIMFVQYQERKIVGQNLFLMTVHKVDDHLILMRLMTRE